MSSHFDVGPWRVTRRRKNLHSRAIPPPRTQHAETTETILTPHLERSGKDRSLDVLADSVPLGNLERLTGLYGDDLFLAKDEHDSAGRPCKRKVKFVRIIGATVMLSRSSDPLVQKEPQIGSIKARPVVS